MTAAIGTAQHSIGLDYRTAGSPIPRMACGPDNRFGLRPHGLQPFFGDRFSERFEIYGVTHFREMHVKRHRGHQWPAGMGIA